MLKRKLGKTGLEVSVLGLGTVKIGRNEEVKYPGGSFELPGDREVEALLDAALSQGVNLLDTAPAYGTSEERLGRLLGPRRDRFVIITKAGEEFSGGRSAYDFSARHIEESVARSLKRLRTDRLDGVLLHCPPNDLEVLRESPALETLARLKAKGDIRSFGASTHSVEAGLLAAERGDMVMVTHHLDYSADLPVIERAAALGKGVLIKKGLQSGRLAEERRKANFAHILGTPGVTSLIVGTLRPEHLAGNAALIE